MSLYSIVDGICVSHFVGTDGLSAVNIVYPMISVDVSFLNGWHPAASTDCRSYRNLARRTLCGAARACIISCLPA